MGVQNQLDRDGKLNSDGQDTVKFLQKIGYYQKSN